MAEQVNEVTEMWRDYRHERQEKRADNRRLSRERLTSEGIDFQERNDGAHLIVIGGPTCVIDFWPGTGKWKERGSNQHGRGVGRLVRLVRHRDSQQQQRDEQRLIGQR